MSYVCIIIYLYYINISNTQIFTFSQRTKRNMILLIVFHFFNLQDINILILIYYKFLTLFIFMRFLQFYTCTHSHYHGVQVYLLFYFYIIYICSYSCNQMRSIMYSYLPSFIICIIRGE